MKEKEIVVLSGKGGTGKTSLVACFASLEPKKVLADCDVDAANLHLVLHPEVKEENEFWSGQKAVIDPAECISCGICRSLCRFGAIDAINEKTSFMVNELSCEGCGLCAQICPVKAIEMRDTMAGYWYRSDTRYGPMVHARLGIARENSGKLVAQVRRSARETAEDGKFDCILTDGPPGIGCPVISCLSGADLALLVTEPTLSGRHDLERIAGLCRHFKVPGLVCINKYDINQENTRQIETFCHEQNLGLAGRIAFDLTFTHALVKGIPFLEYSRNETTDVIRDIWQKVQSCLKKA